MTMRSLLAAAIGTTCLLLCGCSAPCDAIDRYYAGGTKTDEVASVTYETSSIRGPYLPFTGGTNWHIKHELGFMPTSIEVFLSIKERPFEAGAGGFAPSAGNQSTVLYADEHEIVVKNDTCAAYWVRVVVGAPKK